MPDRSRVKQLMDKIVEEKPMTQAELDETRGILQTMVLHQPGDPDPGFPIKPGDDIRAAFLLASFKARPILVAGDKK